MDQGFLAAIIGSDSFTEYVIGGADWVGGTAHQRWSDRELHIRSPVS